MTDPLFALSIAISGGALVVSLITAWITVLRRGRLRATWPSYVFLGPDGRAGGPPKVVLRFMMYTGGARGPALEHMHVRLIRRDHLQVFSVWVYDDGHGLERGSGLHIPPNGVPATHHFLLAQSQARFEFEPGEYTVEVFAKAVTRPAERLLTAGPLIVTELDVAAMRSRSAGMFFDWSSDAKLRASHRRSS